MIQSESKRLLILVGSYYPEFIGGTENYVRTLAQDMKILGWEISIMAPSTNDIEMNYEYEGAYVYRYPRSINPTKDELRGDIKPEFLNNFIDKVKEIRPDLVNMNSYDWTCGMHHARSIKELGLPLVLTIHLPDVNCARGTMMRWGRVPCDGKMVLERCTACVCEKYGANSILATFLSRIPSFICKLGFNINNQLGTALSMKELIRRRFENIDSLLYFSDHIVTVSRWQKEALILNGVPKKKVTFIPKGLSSKWQYLSTQINKKSDSESLRLGYVGRFTWVKGAHILIESFKILKHSDKAELHLYGSVNDLDSEKYLDLLKQNASGHKNIFFHGEVNDENRIQVYSKLDMIAVPSLWFENLPFVISESFAAGIPVMASNISGIDELVDNEANGILLQAGNVKAWSEAIDKIIENPKILKDLALGIPSIKLSAESSSETADLFNEILSGYYH